ncbi:MAG: ATP-binding protein [Candidatus Microsaccharimonas sp.]
MTPIRLSYIWYRRLYGALFLLSLGYVGLFVLEYFAVISIPEPLQVSLLLAVSAGIVALSSLVLVVIAKKIKTFIPALVVYGLFALTTAYITATTGGVNSPFLVVWVLITLTAPLFSAYGWVSLLIIIGTYVSAEYLSNRLTVESMIIITLSSIVPAIVGVVVWRDPPSTDEADKKNVKNLASQLSEVAAKSEIVINAIGDGVIAVDGKGIIQLINPAAQEMLGWGKQDALMLNYKSILKLSDENSLEIDTLNDPVSEVLNSNQEARNNKLNVTTNSGKKLSISLVASPIGDPGAGAIAVFRDMTKERAEEREQAEFISTASHEMRTPVASIEGYLGLALNPQTATIDHKARDFILKAHESAQHLGRLFQDLLDVSKSEDGRMTNYPKVVDLVPFTQSVVEGLAQKATEKGLSIAFVPRDMSGSQRKIMPVYYSNIDNDRLREVLDNLIENAIKYTMKGTVTVDVTGTEDQVTISIKDTGLGIPVEDLSHLFQKFYRVNNMDRQSIGGTGLGLYLSRKLIESMQGRIWVESEYEKGSIFYVELPRLTTQEAERLKHEQEQVAAQTAKMTVTAPITAPLSPHVTNTPPSPQTTAQQARPTTPSAAAKLEPTAKPATTVPRGETLTRDQINERVRQLEALARQQRTAPPPGREK